MLYKRILTALVLIPAFIFLLFCLSPQAFCEATAVVVIVGAWEWSAFLGIKKYLPSLIYPLLTSLILLFAFLVPIVPVLYGALVFWLIAIGLIALYPRLGPIWGNSVLARGLMGWLALVPCWVALNYIRNAENGKAMILYIMVLIWSADSAAYFVGRAWGKHRLAAAVSPGKSIEGVAGAFVAASGVALIVFYLLEVPKTIWLGALALSWATVFFAIVGDLFESLMKRNVALKDSGRIFPGHGGLLDRIDSLTAAVPIFTLGALWL